MGRTFQTALAVFLGGVAGSSLRFAVGELLVGVGWSATAPVLVVNLLGALCLGWFAERARHAAPWSTPVIAFVGVGLLGSFTTFSAFRVETVALLRSGAWLFGVGYVVISLVGGFIAAKQGRMLASRP
ncbi:MAG: fluoride efflux transporter CrcB [Acidimicrobiia bacterium]|nr:MAG: fluoride efflux transporter CrcB [Acidimicrobiia bacterium]